MSALSGHEFYKGITLLNRQSVADQHSKYQPFIDHLRMVAETLNAGFAEFGIPVRVAADEISERVLRGRDGVNRWLSGESDGALHAPQLLTFVEVLANILTSPTKNIAVNGVTQCGKTGTSNAMYFLGPILYILNGERYATVMLTINRQSSYDQTNNEFERFISLYGEFLYFHHRDGNTVLVDGEEVFDLTYNAYWETILRGVLPRELGLNRPTDQIRRRSPGKFQLGEIKKLFDVAKEEKAILAMLVDETHFGSETGGTQSIIFDYVLPDLKSPASKNIFIGFSATNWELCNLDNVTQVFHRLGPGYVGFNMFNGQVVDPTIKVPAPRYYGASVFAREFGFERLEEIRSSCYTDVASYNRHTGLRHHNGYWNYQRWVEAQFVKLIHWALLDANPQGGRGLALRFCRSNDKASNFAHMLRHAGLDAGIDVIEYFDGANRVRVKEAIERRPDSKKPYVIMMTASGRLADAFPPHCTYFVDLTHQTQNYTALMQGTVGRATGYGKNSLIILSDENAGALARYVETLGSADAGRVSQRVVQVKGRGRAKRSVQIMRDTPDPFIRQKLRELEDDLKRRFLKRKLFPMTSQKTPGPNGGRCDIWQIFNEATLLYIEAHASQILDDVDDHSFRLLRPDQPYMGNMYDVRDGIGLIGLRKGHRNHDSHREYSSQLHASRPLDDTTQVGEREKWAVHRPQVHYSRQTGDLIALSFRCENGYHKRSTVPVPGTEKPLPSSKSHMVEFASEEQRRLIRECEKPK